MERLVDAVHEVASLAILDGDAARIIQRVEPGRALRADLRVGARLPLAQSASGRVLLAFGDPAVVQRLRADGLALPSDRELEAIRAAGFAHSIDDEVDELSAMAVPVHNWERAYVAALSVVGPAGRFDHEASKQALLAAAEEIDRLVVAEPETTVVRMRREME
jgi:DNA-binding IclR family transcriptional regulator